MSKVSKKSRFRLNLEFSEQVRDRLERLSEETDSSLTEVVRRSLAVLELLLDEQKAGSEIISRRDDGDETKLLIL